MYNMSSTLTLLKYVQRMCVGQNGHGYFFTSLKASSKV